MLNMDYKWIKRCPILIYTSIVENEDSKEFFCTTIHKFEQDLRKLLKYGFHPISLQELHLCRSGKAQWRENPVCIVFLGGYENNYTLAFPIAKRLNIPISIFIATDLVGVREYPGIEGFCPHFSWEQAKEMVESGLVEIFPMWHPFDARKPIDEVAVKINLIKDKLHASNICFAIAHTNCSDNELIILNNIGIRVCLTDCFHISINRIKNGMLPTISVDRASDVIDVINHYEKLCNEVIEKEISETQTIHYVEPSLDILSETIVLPIDEKPIARNYLRHAFPLSILQATNKERAERLILNEYIDVIYKPWYNWYDYHNYYYTFWDCLDCKRMTADLLEANSINIIEYVIKALKLGYYSDIWLDTYYIPDKPGFGKVHNTHGIIIYSYFSDSREFGALSYNNADHYDELRIPVEALYMGCSNRHFEYINLIKNNLSAPIDYDIHLLHKKLKDYLNSICYDDNKRYSKKCPLQYYNLEANQKLIETLLSESTNLHITSLYGFAEHKRIMMWRLKYIAEKEELPLYIDDIYSSVYNDAESLVNLGIKFNRTKNPNDKERIIKKMENMCEEERTIIYKITDLLDKRFES